LRLQTAADVFVGVVIMLGRQLLEVTHPAVENLQNLAHTARHFIFQNKPRFS